MYSDPSNADVSQDPGEPACQRPRPKAIARPKACVVHGYFFQIAQSICTSKKIAKFRKVCTEKQSGTGTSARVHATYIRVCRRAGALPSPVLFLVRSAVGLVHTFNACSDSQACFAGAINPAAKPSCSCAHLLAVPQCVVANLFTLNVCIYLVRLRVQRAEGIQHLCAAFGHGPRPSRQRLHTVSVSARRWFVRKKLWTF